MLDVREVRQYTDDSEVDDYVESLGSIETIGGFLETVEPASVKNFLDIGCSFGFGPHIGREIFGWNVLGIEPGAGARRGSKELDVEIRDEFFSADTRFDREFDFVLSSEVIEHVPDPVSFLRAVRSHLTPTGRATFTTPAAEAVVDGESKSEALIAISPGDHGFLTSVTGLKLMLERAGWESFHIERMGRSLTATASRRVEDVSLPLDSGRPTLDELIDYFDRQADRAPAGSAMRTGMASRHFRALVNCGNYEEAGASAPRVVEAVLARHGVDLGDIERTRDRFSSGGSVPLSSVSFVYHSAMLKLLGTADYLAAIDLFDLAILAADARQVLHGMIDPASADLRINAYRHRVLAAAYVSDPRVSDFLDALRDHDDAASIAQWTMSSFEHLLQGSAFDLARDVMSRAGHEHEKTLMAQLAAGQYSGAVDRRDWRRARTLGLIVRSARSPGDEGFFHAAIVVFPRVYFVARLLARRLRLWRHTRSPS